LNFHRKVVMIVSRSDVEILLVGDELLKGERTDAHAAWLGARLLRLGARVARVCTVGDDAGEISAAIRDRLAATRVLIVTGGLGPTPDDVTTEAVSSALGLGQEFHEPSWDTIQKIFAAHGRQATEINRKQAMFPAGAAVLPNELGTAPGFTVDARGATIFVLPGPPVEVHRMFEQDVLPRLSAIFGNEPVRVETFRTIGVGESSLRELIGDKLDALSAYTVSSLPSRISGDLILTEKPDLTDRNVLEEEANRFERDLREKIGNYFFERGGRSLFNVVHDRLIQSGETLAVAESLTGGWIGKQFTDLPGSSAYLLSDVVAYADRAKAEFLGVQPETIEKYGAVSEETCTEMAHGARHKSGATWGLATTGIAGPDGGTPRKPVGLTYLGISWDGGCLVKRQVYAGTRDDVRRRASAGVVWMLFDRLNS
jgi:nicotinamide-nucleotide amidase